MVRQDLSPDELLMDLASGVPSRQYEAYLALGNLRRPEEIDAVVSAYSKGHHGVRSYVGRYLGDLGTTHSLQHLWRLVQASEGGERKTFLEVLTRVAESNLDKADLLVEGLKDTNPELVMYCVKYLSRSRSSKAVIPLAHLYDKSDGPLRIEILKTLEDIRDSRSLVVARHAVLETDTRVICQGLHLMRALGSERDAKIAIRHLGHAQPKVREYACWNLSKESRKGASGPLMATLQKDQDPLVRAAAAKALMSYEKPESAKALLGSTTSDPSLQVRMVAAFTLASYLSEDTNSVLMAELSSTDRALRRSAIDHLALRGSRRALKALTRILRDEKDLGLRCGAATALGHIGDLPSAPELESHLGGEIPLAYVSAQALCRIWDVRQLGEIARILKDGGLFPEVLHVFASHVAKISHVTAIPGSLIQQARSWMASGNMDLRYFGVDVLARAGSFDDFDAVAQEMSRSSGSLLQACWAALKSLAVTHSVFYRQRMADGWTCASPQFWTALTVKTPPVNDVLAWVKLVVDHYKYTEQPWTDTETPFRAPVPLVSPPTVPPIDEELIWPEDVLPADAHTDGEEPDDAVVDDSGERIDIGGLDVKVEVRASGNARSSMEFFEAPPASPPEIRRESVDRGGDMTLLFREDLRPAAAMLRWVRRLPDLIPILAGDGTLSDAQCADALRRVSRVRPLSQGEKLWVGTLLSRAQGNTLSLLLRVVENSSPPEALGALLDLSIKQSHAEAREVLGRILGGSNGL